MIKKHIKKNKINTKVISCKTIRDKNFVAYSSRLNRLNKNEKFMLFKIIKYLKNYKKKIISNKIKFNKKKIINMILSLGARKVDYVEVLDIDTLKRPKKNKFNIFFAFYIGKIRLIDNF